MRCTQSEEKVNNFVFIFRNKDLLKKMKIEFWPDAFYKEMDKFAKKKRKIELIYK